MVPEVVWFMHLGIPDLGIYAHTLVAVGKMSLGRPIECYPCIRGWTLRTQKGVGRVGGVARGGGGCVGL